MEKKYFSEFLLLYSMNLLNLLTPGANFTITMRNSIALSRKTGLFTALGVICGSSIHKIPTILGLGFLQTQSVWIYEIVRYIGCAFLLYLGIKTIWVSLSDTFRKGIIGSGKIKHLSPKQQNSVTEYNDLSTTYKRIDVEPKKAFYIGFFTDVLNPQATFCFLAIVGATVAIDTPIHVRAFYSVALICTSMFWYFSVALFFSQPFFVNKCYEVRPYLERIAGIFLITLSYRLFYKQLF